MEIMHLLSKTPMEACKWIYSCKEFSVDFEYVSEWKLLFNILIFLS